MARCFFIHTVLLAGLALLVASGQRLGATTYLSEEEALAMVFPAPDRVELKRVLPTREQRAEIEGKLGGPLSQRFFKYYEGRRGDGLSGYAVIGNVIGKHQPITYLIGFDPGRKITLVEILAYRESYGHEIRSERFRRQFRGKRLNDTLALNEGIQNIAGATLSCRALIKAARENLVCLAALVPAEPGAAASGIGKRDASPGTAPRSSGPRVRSRLLMGTTLEIAALGPEVASLDAAINGTFEEVARIESLLSTYLPESEISRLNRNGAREAVALSPEVYELLLRCRAMTHESEGVFDVTAEPLIRLWSEAESSQRLPSADAIATARERVGIHHVEFLDNHRVRFTREGVNINLGAIGKGYAMDRAEARLRALGVHQALLNFGGQILAMDPPDGQSGWTVGIRRPSGGNSLLGSVVLANQALATSADDQRGMRIGGRVYSHIIDARTGYPADALACATVLARSGEEADAWSTALFGIGPGPVPEPNRGSTRAFLTMDRRGVIRATSDAFLLTN